MKSCLLIILAILILDTPTFSQLGRLERITVYSQSIDGNLLGDSPNRNVSVYLPHQYDSNPTDRFPVIYMLHGYGYTDSTFIDYFSLVSEFNLYFSQTGSNPIIIVVPDNYNFYWGSFYTNSIVTGDWEDFVTQELIEYIDNNYRTSPHQESRGISGWSMGGYGTIMLAMKHPDIYKAVYALSAANLETEEVVLNQLFDFLVQAACATDSSQFNGLPGRAKVHIASGAAFSPNINPHPFYCDLPVDCTGNLIDSTWQKWLEHDPYSLIDTYKNNLLQYNGNIRFDCGDEDFLFDANCIFDTALTEKNIPHIFEVYPGTHFSMIPKRVRENMLPFFSGILTDVEYDYQTLPSKYTLQQNYPNPFNPATKIKYSIPQTSNLLLKVFDILGKEIEVLVNEEKRTGTYEITWYAENLPSGIYFYRLQAGDYIETKKMVLMK